MANPPLAIPILSGILFSLTLTSGIGLAADDQGRAVAVDNQSRARQVEDADVSPWAMPVRKFDIVASPIPDTNTIRRKLETIIIPKLELREATVREAVAFLKAKSAELDGKSAAGNKGVNFVFRLEESAPPAGNPVAAGGPAAGSAADTRITVSLTDIPLVEALKYVTGLANLKFKVEPDAVFIVPLTASSTVLVTKEWKIPPDLIPRPKEPSVPAGAAAAAVPVHGVPAIVDRESGKNWLIANGVTFDGAASAIYIVKSSRLIVRNTQEQLDFVEAILKSESYEDSLLVEIECKVVEISQDKFTDADLASLLGQFHPPIDKSVVGKGDASWPIPVAALAALHSPSAGAVSDVFSDPQFQLIMRALNQKSGIDMLPSAKVTTRNGQPAVIKFIRDSRDHEEDGALANGSSAVDRTRPHASANRGLNVTLEAKAAVGSDGYTLDLELNPHAVKFDGLTTESLSLNRNDEPDAGDSNTPATVSIYDGSTVMLGGLLREAARKSGDTARSSGGEQPHGHKLLIFVTARLINTGSSPVRSEEEKEEVVETIAPPQVAPIELPLMPK